MRDQVVRALVLGVGVLSGCGGTSTLTCGHGTVEKDGQCVVDDADDDGSAGMSGKGGAPSAGGTGAVPGGKGGTGGTSGVGATAGTSDPGTTGGTGGTETCALPLHDYFIAFDSDRGGLYRDIFVARADGTELWNLTNTPDVDESDPEFSPDGTSLLYVLGSGEVAVMDAETRQSTPVATGKQPTWSSDASEIAFHSVASVLRLRFGEDPVVVVSGPDELNGYAHPAYYPGDEVLVMDRNNQISAMNLDGTDERYVVQNWTTTIVAPDVSPDGTFVVSAIWCESYLSLWVSPFAENTIPYEGRSLTATRGVPATEPSWGPENLIAYVEGTEPRMNIAVVSADTREACTLITGGVNRNPSWAPDAVLPLWLEP